MNDEYIEPSTAARVILAIYVVLLFMLGLLTSQHLDQLELPDSATPEQLEISIQSFRQFNFYLLAFTLLQALVGSAVLLRMANMTIKNKAFPPPGSNVIKRTRVVKGEKAVRYATISYLLALIVWLPVLIPVYVIWFLNNFR